MTIVIQQGLVWKYRIVCGWYQRLRVTPLKPLPEHELPWFFELQQEEN